MKFSILTSINEITLPSDGSSSTLQVRALHNSKWMQQIDWRKEYGGEHQVFVKWFSECLVYVEASQAQKASQKGRKLEEKSVESSTIR